MINIGLEQLNHKENKLKQDSQSEVTLLVPNKVTKITIKTVTMTSVNPFTVKNVDIHV